MLKQLFIATIFIVMPCALSAQSDCQVKYDETAIYLRTEFWRGTTFVQAGKSKPVGLFFGNLEPAFEIAPRSAPLYRKAQRQSKIAFGTGLVGLTGAITGLVLMRNALQGNQIRNERQYNTGAAMVLGGVVISAVVSTPLNIKAQGKLADAIHLRNRELLK